MFDKRPIFRSLLSTHPEGTKMNMCEERKDLLVAAVSRVDNRTAVVSRADNRTHGWCLRRDVTYMRLEIISS